MRVLVVCAHPDDEVVGAGGTLARHARAGDEVTVAILATGVLSRQGDPETLARALTRLREDAGRANASIGVRELLLGDLEDQRLDTLPMLDVARVVEGHLERVRPDVVYTNHYGDLNADHVVTYRAVLTAARPRPDLSVRRILAFEVASSTEWNVPYRFAPTVFVDVTQTIEAKLAAMAQYTGEIRDFPHPRSREALLAISQRWGSVAGMRNAEAFELVRELDR